MLIRQRSFQLFVAAFLVFVYALVVNAWVVDDAYITFRTVDNFTHGYGLTWNVDERVQAYTHALWMFVMSALSLVTGDVFYTSIFAAIAFSVVAVLVAAATVTERFRTDLWKLPLLVVALLASKAFVDYTSGGLENGLSYLLAALFVARLTMTTGRLTWCFLIASLSYVNRPESVLLFLPALLSLLAMEWTTMWAAVRRTLTATLPATAWTLFSLFYYGFPFPNTAYAKTISTDLPWSWRALRGWEYFLNSLAWDAPSHLLVVAACVLAVKRQSGPAMALMAGVVIYELMIVLDFASATHMSGRFFSVPFFIAIVVCVALLQSRTAGAAVTAVLAAYLVWSPLSPIKFTTAAYKPYPQSSSYIDAKWFVWREGAALMSDTKGRPLPDHQWHHDGEQLRAAAPPVHVGGALGGDAIGYLGFAAGPAVFIVDRMALSDPLLARLPSVRPPTNRRWKSGHFIRELPAGYLESIKENKNLIADPSIREQYERIRMVTRGPLLSWARVKDIIRVNLGLGP